MVDYQPYKNEEAQHYHQTRCIMGPESFVAGLHVEAPVLGRYEGPWNDEQTLNRPMSGPFLSLFLPSFLSLYVLRCSARLCFEGIWTLRPVGTLKPQEQQEIGPRSALLGIVWMV